MTHIPPRSKSSSLLSDITFLGGKKSARVRRAKKRGGGDVRTRGR